MNSSNKKNLLNCFVTNERNSIISLIFDQDNNFTLLNKFSNLTETSRISIITQNLSPDREKALVCYITGEAYLKCFIYNLEIENKKWNQSLKLIESYNIIKGIGNVEFLSISQFPLNKGGYFYVEFKIIYISFLKMLMNLMVLFMYQIYIIFTLN